MSHITRRSLLVSLSAMVGGAVVAPIARAYEFNPDDSRTGFVVTRPFMTPDQRKLTAAMSERIIPTTDTPGAIAAGVPAFIEMMLSEWYIDNERDIVMGGLAAADAFSRKHYKHAYARLKHAHQDAVLTMAMNGELPGAPSGFFEHMRQLVIFGYYSSEIGCTVERVYLPVPGHYDGAYPYAKVGRVFSS